MAKHWVFNTHHILKLLKSTLWSMQSSNYLISASNHHWVQGLALQLGNKIIYKSGLLVRPSYTYICTHTHKGKTHFLCCTQERKNSKQKSLWALLKMSLAKV